MSGKKVFAFFAVAALLCVSLAGIAPAEEKAFIYNLRVEPRTIDPVLNNAVDGSTVIYNVFEGLVRIGFDDRPEPGYAKSWDVKDDGMTWVFHLRDDMKWSDGKPMTAEHFRYGFMRLIRADVGSPYSHYGFFIKNAQKFYEGKAKEEEVGLKALDDKTFEIRLEYKWPLILDYLAYHVFYPARPDVVDKDPRGWTTKPETIVCNGPFVLTDWRHNSELTVTKNPNYWDAANVKIDKVRLVMIADDNTSLAAFKSGKIDFFKNVPPAMVPQLIAAGEAKVAPTLGTAFVCFNLTRKPWDDPRVRKAFSLAIDREAMVTKVTQGGQKPAVGFIPDVIPGGSKDKDFRAESPKYLPVRADVAEARKLLAEAGYPDGKGFPKMTYTYNTSVINKGVAEALQAMWKQNLGVTIELTNQEWKVFIDTRIQKNYDLARHAYLVDFFDAGSLFELFVTGFPENVIGLANPEYDAYVKAAMSADEPAKRAENFRKAEEILMKDSIIAPIYFYATPYMVKPTVKGLYMSPRNWDFFRGVEIAK